MKIFTRNLLALALTLTLSAGFVAAKKVKFMVNMSGLVKNAAGMHITGDFQTLAGYPGGDWNSASTPLFQEPSDTNLYSLVVDIPAHSKYEYKFVNGIQFYEVEFVPVQSRVGYNFNDNRWIYVDSTSSDTMIVGPLRFSGNAPMGMYMMRFLVDMTYEASVSPNGVHVSGSFDSWVTPKHMYSFTTNMWEHIDYVDSTAGSVQFLYYNGVGFGFEEIVSGSCTASNTRFLSMPNDTVLPVACFGSCAACVAASIGQGWVPRLEVYPNPASDAATVRLSNHFAGWDLQLLDQQGRVVRSVQGSGEQAIRIEREDLPAGLYFVNVQDENGDRSTQKLIFQ
jgi:hypothetical protein